MIDTLEVDDSLDTVVVSDQFSQRWHEHQQIL
jgi:hypothetical protein